MGSVIPAGLGFSIGLLFGIGSMLTQIVIVSQYNGKN